MSTCVTAIAVPNGLTDREVRDHAVEHYGVMVSGGHGAGNLVRIGHMGAATRSMYPIAGLAAVGCSLRDLGANVDLGTGLDVALGVLSDARVASARSSA